jgi:dipeptidase
MSILFRLILIGFFAVLFTENQACTSYLVTKGASVDGSTMISYAADSHIRYGEIYYRSGGFHKEGEMVEIRDRSTNELLGKIPQAKETYNVVGYMNEHQVSIGETTFGGRKELLDTTGLMDYAALMFLVLDRAKTAREAIQIIADLVEEYGYPSWGESFSIADKNEVWIMEIVGKGMDFSNNKEENKNKGAVWVAMRIPDGYISAHANHARITQFPLRDGKKSISSKDFKHIHKASIEVIYAHDVIDFAREQGYFDGKDSEFSFSDTYAPLDFGAARFCEIRVWSFFRRYCDGMDEYLDYVRGNDLSKRMPLWVKPNRKLSVADLIENKRDYLQGTEFDMTKDIGAGAHQLPYRWRPLTWEYEGKTYINERATRTQQTGFSFITQARAYLPDPIGGIIWFSVDDAGTTVYVPMYSSITKVPETYAVGNGDMLTYSPTSAFWTFNKVSNFAYLRYDLMIEDIQKRQKELEDGFFGSVKECDAQALALMKDPYTKGNEEVIINLLTNYSVNAGNYTVESWNRLFEFLLVKYMDGNVKQEKNGEFIRNDWGYPAPPKHVGYPDYWKKIIIEETGDKFLMPE